MEEYDWWNPKVTKCNHVGAFNSLLKSPGKVINLCVLTTLHLIQLIDTVGRQFAHYHDRAGMWRTWLADIVPVCSLV